MKTSIKTATVAVCLAGAAAVAPLGIADASSHSHSTQVCHGQFSLQNAVQADYLQFQLVLAPYRAPRPFNQLSGARQQAWIAAAIKTIETACQQ